ncbi:MAG: hypothetical protein ACTHZ5_03600 [Micrococcaceae bacterium]
MTAEDASRTVRVASTLILGALLLVGCREGAPGTEGTAEPSAPQTSASATEDAPSGDPEELTEQHLSQALQETMGEDSEITTGDDVVAQQLLRQQWGDVESAEPAECLASLVGAGRSEDADPVEGAEATEATAESTSEETTDVDEPAGPLEEAGAELAAAGTTVDASQPGSFLIEQLTVMSFAADDDAIAYVLDQRDVAVRCSTVDVTLGNGTQLRADTEVNELSHHTEEALEVLNAIAPADSDENDDDGGAQLPPMEISTVLVRDGDLVYSYLSTEQSDVGVGLTFIDQLGEAIRAEES